LASELLAQPETASTFTILVANSANTGINSNLWFANYNLLSQRTCTMNPDRTFDSHLNKAAITF
jgi:hypothetical protein